MRSYLEKWDSPGGNEYRRAFYERSGFKETNPIANNIAVKQLISDLEIFNPQSILEIGCGFGRFLKCVTTRFESICVAGCDISEDMLSLCDSMLNVSHQDICSPSFFEKVGAWDIGYSRCVFVYFDKDELTVAMKNVSDTVRRKMLVYEWPEIIKRMEVVGQSIGGLLCEKFVYHEVAIVTEISNVSKLSRL